MTCKVASGNALYGVPETARAGLVQWTNGTATRSGEAGQTRRTEKATRTPSWEAYLQVRGCEDWFEEKTVKGLSQNPSRRLAALSGFVGSV